MIGGLRLDVAGRHEHFSDFGNKTVGKLTARYDFSPEFAVRGTVSNGFRAPTVAEGRYTKSSTSPTSTGVNLAPNSPAAALFGLGELQPETSTNYSLGVVFNPVAQFTSSLDVYPTWCWTTSRTSATTVAWTGRSRRTTTRPLS